MKKITLLTAIVVIAFTTNAVAQSTATATAQTSARVITPITITKVVDLNFGNLVATVAGGAIVLPTSGARTGEAAILAGANQKGTVTAASFTVTGETNFTYAISLPPASFNVSNSDTTPATMSVGTFVSLPASTGSLVSGTQTLLVGATITLAANQKAGAYTNTSGLAITVNYN